MWIWILGRGEVEITWMLIADDISTDQLFPFFPWRFRFSVCSDRVRQHLSLYIIKALIRYNFYFLSFSLLWYYRVISTFFQILQSNFLNLGFIIARQIYAKRTDWYDCNCCSFFLSASCQHSLFSPPLCCLDASAGETFLLVDQITEPCIF